MIHRLACVGSPPEHRDWKVGDPMYVPDVHPTARVEAFVTVDSGLTHPTRVGARSWLMKGCHLGHDVHIGEDCELAPRTVIGGHAVLEDGVRCGIGVLVLPFKRIGKGARLGAGAVVTKDVPAGEVWFGNPARKHVKHDWPSADLTQAEVDGWEEWWKASCGETVEDERFRLVELSQKGVAFVPPPPPMYPKRPGWSV